MKIIYSVFIALIILIAIGSGRPVDTIITVPAKPISTIVINQRTVGNISKEIIKYSKKGYSVKLSVKGHAGYGDNNILVVMEKY